jgi:hypothetical protein
VGDGGITSLNGLTGNSQTFSIGFLGTTPAWFSAGTNHGLDIPMAAAAGVVGGLISKAQYDAFNAKANVPVVVADVTTVLKTRQFGYIAGSDAAAVVLADTDDQATIYVNRLGQGITITEVFCECDAGTPRIQLVRDDGTPANILTDNAGAGLDCAAGGTTGTLDATEKLISNGHRVDFTMVTAGGVAKRVTVFVKYTLD